MAFPVTDKMQRPTEILRPLAMPLLILAVIVVCAGVIAYVQVAVTRIEGELPLRVMQEKQAMERVARRVYEYLAANDAAVADPTKAKVDSLREDIAILGQDLEQLRERYSFDTLIGASALHAALYPVVEDLRIWLHDGFSGLPPTSPVVLQLAATRARNALGHVYDKTAESDRIAYQILEHQTAELRHLRRRLALVIVVFAILSGGFIWLARRQRRAAAAREVAEAERLRLQTRLRDALESTLEGFAFFDHAERLVTCNTRYREFFLRDIRDVVVPQATFAEIAEAAAARGVVAGAVADPRRWFRDRLDCFRKAEGPFMQQLGDGRWIMINERHTTDGGVVAVYSDVTELKQREIDLVEAKEGAEAANQAKSAFLANVSHELRTPLTSIMGFTRIIQRRLDEIVLPQVDTGHTRVTRAVRQVRDNLNIMLVEGQRLTTLINNVLDLEKIEAGEMLWSIEPLDVTEIMQQAAAATESLYGQKGLDFTLDMPADLPRVLGDRDRLVQVIVNLISNAVKFTAEGGIRCQARPDGGEVRIEVTDTGCGIVPTDQAAVFEKFRQVGDTLTDKPAGTGLGLPICKEIVEHLGGRIGLDSTIGRGSTFHFTIPAAESRAASGG